MVEDQFPPQSIALLLDRSLVAVRRKSVGIRESEPSKRMLSVTLRDSVWRALDHAAYEIRMRPYELAPRDLEYYCVRELVCLDPRPRPS